MTVKITADQAYELALKGDRDGLIRNGWYLECYIETEFGETLTYNRPGVTPAWWQADSVTGMITFHYPHDQA